MAASKAKSEDTKAKPSRKATLTRNAFIDGAWYGPAWGNAEGYPADVTPDTHAHLFAED